MIASQVYFSLSEITDPGKHRAHNEWHQLDHQPENFLLPGVVAGSRWVRSPDCAAATRAAAPGYDAAHYAILYWFREPLERTLDDFFRLSELSFQWGRSPQIGFTHRPMRGFFAPIRGHVASRIGLPADALAFRPVRGVYVTLSRLGRLDAATRARLAWHDEVRLPGLLECPGVAGAWSFAAGSLAGGDASPSSPWQFADRAARAGAATPDRLEILFLDGDPLEAQAAIEARAPRDEPGVEEILFAGPLRAIVPWEWDWFEARGGG